MITRLTRIAAAALAALMLAGVSGCGQRERVVVYEQGMYKGATLVEPWNGPMFQGDKGAWQHALTLRNQNQNEYWRMGAK